MLVAISVCADERPLPDLNAFIAQVKTKLASDESLQSGYMYNERTITEKIDGSGRTVHQSAKLFEV